ncbi:MAG: MBOAT family protein [Synergistaceae bacterium]|nr:MBOAT family protein [Synergistaceae bacterium]
MSLWFYAFFNVYYLPIIIFSICFNYSANKLIISASKNANKSIWLIIALTVNIGILFYYKYYDFFIENINSVLKTSFVTHHLILPLGISFFTFQQLSYIIDSYRGEVPDYNFLDYALFVTYFPQLIAGPIVTHNEIVPQFADASKKRVNYENLSIGIMTFSFGLAKKVLLADTFGNAVNWGYGNILALNSTDALLIMLFYTFQLYFDFSGYCDMATGIGLMFNISLPMNFNSPYRALTIIDFWKRWHMTLTRFFTRYVYIPLGGSRRGSALTYINIFIVFIVSGLWHGANWTFILWGTIHGVFSLITRTFQKTFNNLHPALNWLITFVFVNMTWIYFRADSIEQANQIIKSIFYFNFDSINDSIIESFRLPEFRAINKLFNVEVLWGPMIYMLFFVLFSLWAVSFTKNTYERAAKFSPTIISSCVSTILIVWCVLSFSEVSTFLYFNF